jgi:hypothetical protein
MSQQRILPNYLDEHSLGGPLLRAFDNASIAVGRLDATARALEPGIQTLLVARSTAVIHEFPYAGIIAILQAEGEGASPELQMSGAVSSGVERIRTGTPPTIRWLADRLSLTVDDEAPETIATIDRALLDMRSEPIGVVPALTIAEALGQWSPLAAATILPLVLVHSGALGGAWCTVELSAFRSGELAPIVVALAHSAREAEQALGRVRLALTAHESAVDDAYGRAAHGALAVLRSFRRWPVLDIPSAARRLRCTRPTITAALERLESLGLVAEITGRGRDRLWCYSALVAAMAGNAPAPAGRAS